MAMVPAGIVKLSPPLTTLTSSSSSPMKTHVVPEKAQTATMVPQSAVGTEKTQSVIVDFNRLAAALQELVGKFCLV